MPEGLLSPAGAAPTGPIYAPRGAVAAAFGSQVRSANIQIEKNK